MGLESLTSRKVNYIILTFKITKLERHVTGLCNKTDIPRWNIYFLIQIIKNHNNHLQNIHQMSWKILYLVQLQRARPLIDWVYDTILNLATMFMSDNWYRKSLGYTINPSNGYVIRSHISWAEELRLPQIPHLLDEF